MKSPSKNTSDLIETLKGVSEDELLLHTTKIYVAALPNELRSFVQCAAVLRWFDHDVLEAVLGSEELAELGYAFDGNVADKAYGQLQRLTFVEPYPGRGYTFHELTRKSLLEELWSQQRNLYLAVATAAFAYFQAKSDAQHEAYGAGKIEEEQVDMGLSVEMLYHGAIVQGPEALSGIQEAMDFLFDERQLGVHHDVITALNDHITGGRLDQTLNAYMQLWKAREAYASWDADALKDIALPLTEGHADELPVEVQIEAFRLMALDAERRAQYASARHFFEELRQVCASLDFHDEEIRALTDLSRTTLNSEDFVSCHRYLDEALERWVLANSMPFSDDVESRPIPRSLYQDPASWNRQVFELTVDEDEDVVTDRTGSEEEIPDGRAEDIDQQLIMYVLEATDDGQQDVASIWRVQIDEVIAELWLNAASLAEDEDNFDRAAACARLAGALSADAGDLSGAHAAVTLLERMGARELDQDLVRAARGYRQMLTDQAASGGDKYTLFEGLISEAKSLADDLEWHQARDKWEEALSIATELGTENSRATCLQGLAEVAWFEGDTPKARANFDQAAEIYAGLANLEGLANSLLTRSKLEGGRRAYADAQRYAKQALEAYQSLGSSLGQFDVFQHLAILCRAQGEYEEALALYQKSLELARHSKKSQMKAVALSSIADLDLALGRRAKAEENYETAIRIARNARNLRLEIQILMDKARLLADMAEYVDALKVLAAVINADEKNPDAWLLKGWCLEQLGAERAAESVEARKMSVNLTRHDVFAHTGLADSFDLLGATEDAEKQWRSTVEAFGENPKLGDLASLGRCYYKLGEYDKAAKAYLRSLSGSEDVASDQFDMALVRACQDRLSEAVEAYEKAVAALDTRLPPRTRLDLLSTARHDLDDLLDHAPALRDAPEIAHMSSLLEKARIEALAPVEGNFS